MEPSPTVANVVAAQFLLFQLASDAPDPNCDSGCAPIVRLDMDEQ